MRLINSFGQKLVINEDSEVAAKLASCYRRTCNKCKEMLPQPPSAVATAEQHVDNMRPPATCLRINQIDVHPVVVRKTPKFRSRERHLAIKRKKLKKKRARREEGLDEDDEEDDNEDYDDDDVETVLDELADEEEDEADVDDVDGMSAAAGHDCVDGVLMEAATTGKKTCQACKCPRDTHAIYQEQVTSVRERLGFKADMHTSKIDPRHVGYTWVPSGIMTSSKIQRFFDSLPEDKVPKIGSTGERHRDKQLAYQLPKQDLSLSYCKHVEPQNQASYEDFVAARNEIALDIGYVKDAPHTTDCVFCEERINQGELAVIAPKFRDQMIWHPRCFQCSACEELLVDLTYCVHDDKIYCERHYAEMLKPRCNACDEMPRPVDDSGRSSHRGNQKGANLIFSGEYTKAMSKDWHSGHFCCWQCDESLTGQRYVLRDDHPYCIKCYENVFANTCEECNKIIGIDSKDLSYKEKHWHEACFLCNKCRVSLVDKQFGSKADKIYCGNCYDTQFASRCDGCGEIFRAGTKKMEYKTRQWHEKCFSCCVCKTPIGTKSFIPREQEIYCAGCYEEKYATRCIKCKLIITSGGVTYKSEPWHRECFTCTNCSTSLAGQRFTSRDEKPYCADCFGELFAKRCTACTKPITGIGGTRFISFEDRHWHNDCFSCASCKTSLVGRGFITDATDIICPECAKQKLM